MKRVMVFGVFDLLHPGHISFLKQAKKIGNFLIVSVARDVNVKKIKGKAPVFDEKKRVERIKQLKLANKVVIGGLKDPWPHIVKENPDIIALGYDQEGYITKHLPDTLSLSRRAGETRNMNQEKQLEAQLRKHGLKTKVIRLRSFRPEVFKSSLMKKKK
jgi:FAD synthetase